MAKLTRDRIVSAASAAVSDAGHERVALRALARDLGVTAPALYDHFDSKDELLRAVAAQGFRAMADEIRAGADRAVERIRERSIAYVAFAAANPELFQLMFLFRAGAVELVDDEGVAIDNELSAATEAFDQGAADITVAMADGDLAERDVNEVAMILWASTHGVATLALTAPSVAAAVIEDVVDTVLSGLAPR